MTQRHPSTDGPWTDPQTHLDTDPVNATDEESDDSTTVTTDIAEEEADE